ncbi:MAG: hypothetical protein M3Y30_03715 [Gemmatimonadota bacterium]|nr:hypothetical protein [Gemmatimonadota bacterium]
MTQQGNEPYENSAAFRADLAAVADAMREVRKTSRYDPRVLHEAVHVCALNARTHRCPPERLVRALKELVREVALNDNTEAYRVLYTDRIIAWAIESYYELTER